MQGEIFPTEISSPNFLVQLKETHDIVIFASNYTYIKFMLKHFEVLKEGLKDSD